MSNLISDYTDAVAAIDGIISRASAMKASDIHLDPKDDGIEFRLRIDGEMRQIGFLPKILHEEIIARLKILSGGRTDLHAVPQDGRFQIRLESSQYNIRISFMPTYHGENAVLRLLPAKPLADFTFSRLGFAPDHIHILERVLNLKHGLILVTGPTGSGKTTTLQSCLIHKSREPLSIITLEDPVEYEIPGIRQVHIRHSYGVSFASGLRAALRQDPDVIMVGEIRDSETAGVVIHTALTGHLVISTLHTNSALEAIPRLIDMGIDHYLLAATLKLVIAQRLVRVMCSHCSAEGCSVCSDTGFSGRSVIAEFCEIDKGFADLISEKSSQAICREYALSHGFRDIFQDGLEKVQWGITTRAEVARILFD